MKRPSTRRPIKALARSLTTASAFLASCLLSWPALAIEGRLVDPEGRPVRGARLAVAGRAGSVVTDSDGGFEIRPEPDYPCEILISRPDGVAASAVRIESRPESLRLDLVMEPSLRQSVKVVASRAADLEIPPAAAFRAVDRAEIEGENPARVADALRGIPGVGSAESGASAVLSIRGLSRSRTLLLLDDGRVTAERRAGPSATFVDPSSLDEIEIVRGPGSVAYGSDALGGVVRMRTAIPSPSDRLRVRWSLTGASAGTAERSVRFDLGAPVLGGGLGVGLSARRFENYWSPDGEVEDSGAEDAGFRVAYQHALAGGALRVIWRTDLGRDIGKPATGTSTTTSYPRENSHRFSAGYERGATGPWSRVAVGLSWDEYRLATRREATPSPAGWSASEADVMAHDYGFRAEGEAVAGGVRLLAGLEALGRYGLHANNRFFTYDALGRLVTERSEVAVDRARRDDLGVFVSASGGPRWVLLSAGARLDGVRSKNAGGAFGDLSRSRTALSGFVAADFVPVAGFDVAIQGARGFREPTLSDRYFRGVTGRGIATGNPDLLAETSLQLDLAVRYRAPDWRVGLYAFEYRVNDLVERYRVGPDYFFRNREEADISGVEIEAAAELARGLSLEVSAQLVRGETTDDRLPTDDVPADAVALVLRHQAGSRWSWYASLEASRRDRRPGPLETEAPGYLLSDVGVSVELNRHLELRAVGRNLLNQRRLATPEADSPAAPGRSVEIALAGSFGR